MKNADYICRLEGVERGLALGSILTLARSP